MAEFAHTPSTAPAFSLLGGPLHRLGISLGLVRPPSGTVRLGLAIGITLWGVAAALVLANGADLRDFSLLGAHVRLLLVIPLLFLAESLLDPRLGAFMRSLVDSRIVEGDAAARLLERLARVGRWRNSAWQELAFLAVAIGSHWVSFGVPGADSTLHPGSNSAPGSIWYSAVCLTVFRFLMLRWAWRIVLWWHCLWCVSRLPLQLRSAHADGTSGLGALETVHLHFAPLVFAISCMLSASLAVDIAGGTMALDAVYSVAAAILAFDALAFVAPLLMFLPALRASKLRAGGDYMLLAQDYAARFERKWLRAPAPDDDLLGSSDIQSLADLTAAVGVVRNARVVPIGHKLLAGLGGAALAPLAPLVLFKIPLATLIGQMFGRLTGL